MADIDDLQIHISAEASSAAKNIQKLADNVEALGNALHTIDTGGLSNLATGLRDFSTSANSLANIKTADFTRLIKNLNGLSTVKATDINNVSSAIRKISGTLSQVQGIGDASKSIRELADNFRVLGGVKVTKAIENLPLLADALNQVFSTLSRAPAVSQNIIDMTNALANLGAQGSRLGSATHSLTSGLGLFSNSAKTAQKHTVSLAAAIGKFYATCWLAIRGVKGLWKSITNGMDYLEVVNYFNAAIDQMTEKSKNEWKNAGYESGQAYTDALTSKLTELQGKMTGYVYNADTSMLEASLGANLGLNSTQLMNYQAVFAQMSSSMGTTSEQATKLSIALTEIGADLASVKNMDFEEVWQDMASGLVGMSRTLDKFGVNIRATNLQAKLTEMGIETNITKLGQNEKALLRTIVLLDSTRYAWADLSQTLNSPANELRQLQSNFNKLSIIIGNFFMPVVQSAMIALNGLTIALQRLLLSVASATGLDLSGIVSSGSTGMSDLLDTIYETDEGLGNATESAKKLKSALNGIDELNVLNQDDSSGSASKGLSEMDLGKLNDAFNKALEEYQARWDEAYANLENKAEEFATKVGQAFNKALDFIKVGDFNGLGKWVGENIANAINKFITPENFKNIGKTLANTLNTVVSAALGFGTTFNWKEFGVSIASGINKFFTTFDFSQLAQAINSFSTGLFQALDGFLSTIDLKEVLKGTWNLLTNLNFDTLTLIFGVVSFKLLAPLAKAKITSVLGAALAPFMTLSTMGTALLAVAGIGLMIKMTLDSITWSDNEEENMNKLKNKIFNNTRMSTSGNGGLKLFFVENSLIALISYKIHLFNKEIEEEHDGSIADWFNKKVYPYFTQEKWLELGANMGIGLLNSWSEFKDNWEKSDFKKWWDKVTPYFTKQKWIELGANMGIGLSEKWNEFSEWWSTTGFHKWWNNKVVPFFTEEKWKTTTKGMKAGLSSKWNDFTDWWDNTGFANWWADVEEKFDKKNWTFQGVIDGIGDAFKGAAEAAKTKWNEFADWLNQKLTFKIDTSTIIGKGIEKLFGTDTVKLASIPKFERGGFPEDGFFYANHEELVGKFSNGRTAVANNSQIIEGVANGVYEGVRDAITNTVINYLDKITANTNEIANKDTTIELDGRQLNNTLYARSQRNGYSFT